MKVVFSKYRPVSKKNILILCSLRGFPGGKIARRGFLCELWIQCYQRYAMLMCSVLVKGFCHWVRSTYRQIQDDGQGLRGVAMCDNNVVLFCSLWSWLQMLSCAPKYIFVRPGKGDLPSSVAFLEAWSILFPVKKFLGSFFLSLIEGLRTTEED